jgi:hypothetical protein
MTTKKCRCCNRVLSLDRFSYYKRTLDKKQSYCKECCSKKNKQRSLNIFKSKRKVRMIKTFGVDHLMEVEEGRQFKTPKDFIKFKRDRLQEQIDKI